MILTIRFPSKIEFFVEKSDLIYRNLTWVTEIETDKLKNLLIIIDNQW